MRARRMHRTLIGAMRRRGRYAVHDVIGRGGMATVHLGMRHEPGRGAYPVAVKSMLGAYRHDAYFRNMFLDEARIALRVRHPNVVRTLDVRFESDDAILVLEYVHGETVAKLERTARNAGNR